MLDIPTSLTMGRIELSNQIVMTPDGFTSYLDLGADGRGIVIEHGLGPG